MPSEDSPLREAPPLDEQAKQAAARELERPETVTKLTALAEQYQCKNQVLGGMLGAGVLGLFGAVVAGPFGGMVGAALGAAGGSYAGNRRDQEADSK